jgi:hypothetical protein
MRRHTGASLLVSASPLRCRRVMTPSGAGALSKAIEPSAPR